MENIQKFRKKGKKLGEYMMTKLRLLRDQKKYRSRGVTLKYMLDRVDSRDLIIVFSSCTRKGIRARYNYVRTLKEVPCNKLFLLDDFASDHRGSFYLGSNMKFEEAVVVRELIDRVREQTGAKRLIFCGSSKGGYTALNFGLDYPGSYMVVGGPQYFLGQSLLDTGNIEALKHIAGQVCKEKVEFLNEYLPKKVAANRYAPSRGSICIIPTANTPMRNISAICAGIWRKRDTAAARTWHITRNTGRSVCIFRNFYYIVWRKSYAGSQRDRSGIQYGKISGGMHSFPDRADVVFTGTDLRG